MKPASPDPAAAILPALGALCRFVVKHCRWQFYLTLAAFFLGAASELMTIGMIMPFIALAITPESFHKIPLGDLFLRVSADHPDSRLLYATVGVVTAALTVMATRIGMLRLGYRFAVSVGHAFSTSIFGRILRQPYAYYNTHDPNEILGSMEKVHVLVYSVLLPLLQGSMTSLLALSIIAFIVAVQPIAALVATLAMALIYLMISYFTKSRLTANGRLIAQRMTLRIKLMRETLDSIREILLERSQPHFERRFAQIDAEYRRAQSANMFINAAPRYVVEAIGIVFIVLCTWALSRGSGGIMPWVPVLGALAFGAYRMLPFLQQAYSGWSQFAGNIQILYDVLALADLPVAASPGHGKLSFDKHVRLDDVGFRAPSGRTILQGISFEILRGSKIGVIGETGAGKSTLVDMLMGLLEPSEGHIRVDDQELEPGLRADWQARIAHVPQMVYLSSNSIARNIAFEADDGVEIDLSRVRDAARLAQLDTFVDSLPDGYDTRVGERGMKISGGQRQRIAIARALYKMRDILILDEATNALDEATEQRLLTGILSTRPHLTFIMVGHRLPAIDFDDMLEVVSGRVVSRRRALSA